MSPQLKHDPSIEDHDAAFTEVSFLLEIFASTVTDMMGGATASVGRIAGRQMAKKIPLYLEEPELETVLSELSKKLAKGFSFSFSCTEDGATIEFGRCAIREVCLRRNTEPGSGVCEIFHYYFDGIVNELTGRPTKSTLLEVGSECRTQMKVR